MEIKYNLYHMNCQACAVHIKDAVLKLNVKSCNINILTSTMLVEYDETSLTSDEIIQAVRNAGYDASIYQNELVVLEEKKTKKTLMKLLFSLILLVMLMYLAMGKMLHILPFFFQNKYMQINLYLQFTLSSTIIIINFHYFKSGFKLLFKGNPSMDTLVALGSSASFIYAIVNLIIISINYRNNYDYANKLMNHLFFDSSAMILTLVSIGKYIEALSKKKTTKSLDYLIGLMPTNVLKKNKTNEFELVGIDLVKINDEILINPYDVIPLDGIVLSGESNVDESSMTGESLYKHKMKDDTVISGSVNQDSKLIIRITKEKKDSTLNQVIEMVSKASSSEMHIERIVDKVSKIFVPVVIVLSILTFMIWMLIDYKVTFSLKMAISVLVISCPCALGLATPLCVMVGTLLASKNNVLIKDATFFEKMVNITTIMIDKTGTLTRGKMELVESTLNDNQYQILASLENHSNHPIAKMIIENNEFSLFEVINPNTDNGYGVSGIVNAKKYYAGSFRYVKKILKEDVSEQYIYLFDEDKIIGHILFKDTIKSSSKKAISLFNKQHIKSIMLTGDNLKNASTIASEANITEYKANLLPNDKASIIDDYNTTHKVLMIGDGINDSVALESAYLSMSMSTNDLAMSSAKAVLVRNNLLDAYNAYLISKKVVKNIKINLFWAFLYNALAIPLAAGAFYGIGITLNPMIAALAMSLSSVCVCLNALRLNYIKIERSDNMKIVVKDMMCDKCKAHITTALSVDGVSNVNIDLKKHLVSVDTDKTEDEIFELIKNAGYTPSK